MAVGAQAETRDCVLSSVIRGDGGKGSVWRRAGWWLHMQDTSGGLIPCGVVQGGGFACREPAAAY
jgi:hypothetical protein